MVVDWKYQDISEVLDNAFTNVYSSYDPLDREDNVLFIRRSVSRHLP
jgi:hypothetical protein